MKEADNLYSSPVIRIIKWRRVIWPGHVTFLREMRNEYTILVGKYGRRIPVGKLRIDIRIILIWILKK
jgi:hypothetical protein